MVCICEDLGYFCLIYFDSSVIQSMCFFDGVDIGGADAGGFW